MKLNYAGGGREGHEEADQIALACGAGLGENVLHLLADRSDRNPPQARDLIERVAREKTVGNLSLGGREAVKGAQNIVGKVDRFFRIGDQEYQVGFCVVAV